MGEKSRRMSLRATARCGRGQTHSSHGGAGCGAAGGGVAWLPSAKPAKQPVSGAPGNGSGLSSLHLYMASLGRWLSLPSSDESSSSSSSSSSSALSSSSNNDDAIPSSSSSSSSSSSASSS